MKTIKYLSAILVSCLLVTVSCDQYPIFFAVSKETKPTEPKIGGSPTNMVQFERNGVPLLCVASGKLHWYAKSKWDKESLLPQPVNTEKGQRVTALAVSKDRLYVLRMTDTDNGIKTEVKYITNRWKGWSTVENFSGYPIIDSIYADPDTGLLFVGARKENSYAILYQTNDAAPLRFLTETGTAMLSGAAYSAGMYFLSTVGGGVYQVSSASLPSAAPVVKQFENNREFMCLIKLKDTSSTIIAIERGGAFYEFKDGSFKQMKYKVMKEGKEEDGKDVTVGNFTTGAFALWEEPAGSPPGKKMLVVGVQGSLVNTTTSSYSHGYVEFDLISDGSSDDGSLDKYSSRRDSGELQTVDDNDTYKSSIGKRPIKYLFQATKDIDSNMTFFASTSKDGLWSYKERPDKDGKLRPQWNAE